MKSTISKLLCFCLAMLPASMQAQVNLTNGLIAHLPLNGDGTDVSGNNNNAVPSTYGVTPTSGYLGLANQAMLFDGGRDNGIMSFATPLLNNRTAFSMSYWFNLSQLTNAMSLVGQDNILETAFYTGPNRVTVYHPTGSVGVNLALGTGVWQHLVVTCDATEMKIYLNGTLTNTLTGNYSLGNNTTVTNLGGNVANQNNNTWLRGKLDEVRFYNRVLNTQEVAALYSLTPLTITISSMNGTTFCAGDNLSVNFTASSDIYSGNIYTLEMSDAGGSFTNPIPVARMSSTALTGTFNTTVPTGTPSGTGYKFRVTSSNLGAVGTASGAVVINGLLGNIPNPAAFRYIGNVGDKDYYISLGTQTFTNARTSCSTNGGVLATIPGQAVNDLFSSNLSTTNAWMGFTDEITEGNFIWTSNAPITFTAWASGQPDNSSNEDYGELFASTGRWNDRTGSTANIYFMELAPAGTHIVACTGSNVTLSGVTAPGAAYSWSGPNGFSSSAQNPVISSITPAGAGTYTVSITAGGCSVTATTTVTVNPLPANINQSATLPASLSAGLLLYYPMNGNATDASGNGNNGTLTGGVTAVADRFGNTGQALQLNGTNGYIDVPDGIYFNGSDFTVTAWVRVAAYTNWARLFDFGNGSPNNNVLMCLSNGTSGKPSIETFTGTASNGLWTSASTLPLNTWSHLTYTFTNGTATIYINGVQVIQGQQTAPTNIVRTMNYIGRSNWASDAYANARMDEFRLYNRLLTSTEIQALINEQPAAITQLARPTAICANSTAQIVLYHSQPGVTYQLKNSVTLANVGASQPGNGDSLVFSTGTLAATTSFFFTATSSATGCSQDLSPVVTVTITPAPAAPVAINDSVCNAGILTLHVNGAPAGGVYNWYNQSTGGTAIPGYTADSLVTSFLDENRSYWVSITNATGCEGPRAQVTAVVLNPLNPPVDIISNLILFYKMDGNLADSSGNGYNATSSGTFSYSSDRFGIPNKAANIMNTGYINAGNPAAIQQLTNQVTISLWIRQTQTWFGDNTPVINKWNGNGIYMGLEGASASPYNNPVRWRIDNSSVLVSNTNIPVAQWHHIVCTYNGAQLRIYQNGVLTGTQAETGTIPNTGVNLQIGRQADGNGPITFRGDIDHVRIYSRALNQSEISTLYNNESVAFSNSPLCDAQGNLILTTFNFPGATYQWTGPNGFSSTQQNPPVITNATTAASGTYNLQVTNYGCISPVQPVNVVINPLPSVTLAINDTVCGSGNADLVVGGGGAGSTYAWYTQPSGGSAIAGQTDSTYTVNNLTSTTIYYVAAISPAGCQGPRTAITAVYNSNVLTNLSVSGSTVCSNAASASLTVSGSEAGVNYQAFLGATPVSPVVAGGGTINLPVNVSALGTGNNSITVKATRPGCGSVSLTNTATVVVNAAPAPTISTNGPTTFCEGGNVMLTSSSASSYSWNTGATLPAITVTVTGTYSVTVTDANGCTGSSAPVNVTVNPLPSPTITPGGPTTFCSGNSVMLTAGGGGTYLWSTNATGTAINVAASGTYHVTVTLAGCSSVSSDVTVNVLPLPTVGTSASPSATVCAGDPVTLSGSGAVSYSWSGGITDGQSFIPSGTTTYTVTGTGANSCTNTATITVTVNNLPNIIPQATPGTSICTGNSVTLNGTGAAMYSWSGGVNDGVLFTPSATTTYTVTGTSAAGCTNTGTITITVQPLPVVGSLVSPAATVCSGTSVTLSGTGATSYSWTGSVTDGVPFAAMSTTTYTVTGTDANGCSSTSTVSLTVNTLPVVDAGAGQAVCTGDSVTLAGTGASSYTWSGGVSDNIPFVPSGTLTYTVTGTDANNCSNTDAVTVTVLPLPAVSGGPDQVSCSGSSITLSGTGAASYTWTGGITDNMPFVPASSGAYIVTGTDANNCSNTDTVEVIVGTAPVFSLGADIVQPNPPALLDAGSGWSSMLWSTGATTETISVNANATIICTVTDSLGCTASDTIAVWFTAGLPGTNDAVTLGLYPNPNDGKFTLEIKNLVTGNLTITVVDMLGRTVFQQTGINMYNVHSEQMNLQGLPAGVYDMLLSWEGTTRQLRFIRK